MTFREQFIGACRERAAELARKLTFDEVVAIAETTHQACMKQRRKAEAVPEAEQVYALYPKKVGRDEALRAITKQLKSHPLAYLLDKTNQFAEAVNSWPVSYRYFQDGGDRCPHPASWFNQGRFADDPKEWRRSGARKPAEHQHVSPPEPDGWRERFPDFVDKDKPWPSLQPAQQTYIINSLAMGENTEVSHDQNGEQK